MEESRTCILVEVHLLAFRCSQAILWCMYYVVCTRLPGSQARWLARACASSMKSRPSTDLHRNIRGG